ncbi:MAG TPA: hypothetical protein VMH83_11530 [Candidatus Acidoferrum sp.]|nr:hypothetical protein [Candidatus Acidoferrum sp.]
MKQVLTLVALLLGGCTTQPRVGDIIHPKAGEFGGTGLCLDGNGKYPTCAFSISAFPNDVTPTAVAALVSVAKDATGLPAWRVVDLVALPRGMNGKHVQFDACRFSEDASVPVVGVFELPTRDSPEFLTASGWAYKLELPAGKFVAVKPESVSCAAVVGED